MPPTVLEDEPMEDGGGSMASSENGNMTPISSVPGDVDMNDGLDSGPLTGGSVDVNGEEQGESESEGEGEGEGPGGRQTATDKPKRSSELEELFDDMSDDEMMSSAPVHTPASSFSYQVPPPTVEVTANRGIDPEAMRSFYQRLFPWRQFFHWLNHSPTPTIDFRHRDFAFELQNGGYLRYQSHVSWEMLRKDILRLNPTRFEIGAVYKTNPRDRKTLANSSAFKAMEKELCFDIDLTDYDEVRTCCAKADMCRRCWRFVTMAIKVVDAALRDDFGFRHIMWVYSGRRGAHAWVCDKKARELEDGKRRAVVGYLDLIKGGAQGAKRVNVKRPLHPHLTRSLDILKTHFQDDVLATQDPWESSEQAEKLLQLLPDRTLNESLRRKWDAAPGRSSTSKWADIDAVAKSGASKNLDAKALLEAKQDVVLEYTYPRLDVGVTRRMDHLLKTPFAVHPKTGRVCVPIDPRALEEFDPLGVPTLQSLLAEIDAWRASPANDSQGDQQHDDDDNRDASGGSGGSGGRRDDGGGDDGNEKAREPVADWEKTSLKPFVDYFRSFANGLMREEAALRVKRGRDEGRSLEF